MSINSKYNTAVHFDRLFQILSSPRFLNKEGLGGELPFFIHSYPVQKMTEVELNIESLYKRLCNDGTDVYNINLHSLCIEILKREGLFDKIIMQEKSLPKQRLLRVLSGPLNIDNVILPEIHSRLAKTNAKMVFLTGVGAVFPIIRSLAIDVLAWEIEQPTPSHEIAETFCPCSVRFRVISSPQLGLM